MSIALIVLLFLIADDRPRNASPWIMAQWTTVCVALIAAATLLHLYRP